MKISELIAQLHEQLELHGDLDVMSYHEKGDCYSHIRIVAYDYYFNHREKKECVVIE